MRSIGKSAVTVLMALSFAAAGAGVAAAAPPDKCAKNPENFKVVDGVCMSDGKAEKRG